MNDASTFLPLLGVVVKVPVPRHVVQCESSRSISLERNNRSVEALLRSALTQHSGNSHLSKSRIP